MRNAVFNYSSELLDQFNNNPIASSEISYDNSNVLLETNNSNDLSKPSIIRFEKINSVNGDTDENERDNNIIEKITNPKTWNNGVMVLIVSIILIIGSSYIFIKNKRRA